jgi:Icc-related predicted phosphoesterase
MKIVFVADIQGSTTAFERLLAALATNRPDAAVVLGDLTGGTFAALLKIGPSRWQTTVDERIVNIEGEDELAAVRATLESRGHYWLDVPAEEFAQMRAQPELVDLLFKSAVRRRLEEWLEKADAAMQRTPTQLFMCPGVNDWRIVDGLLQNDHRAQPCDGLIVPLDGYEMITVGTGGPDAEGAVRAEREDTLLAKMETLFGQARNPRYVIFNAHPRTRAAAKIVKRHQPLLRVMGAGIGGQGGVSHVGRTVVLNPGVGAPDDGSPGIRGVLVELEHGQVKDYRFFSG